MPNYSALAYKLAGLLEQKGDYIAALEQYERIVQIEPRDPGPRKEYEDAQQRAQNHLAALKAAGDNAKAAEFEAQLETHSSVLANDPAAVWQANISAGMKALDGGRFEDAEKSFQGALAAAEALHPRDYRLVLTLHQLGALYTARDRDTADGFYRRQLEAATEIYGPLAPETADALDALGWSAVSARDFAVGENYLVQSLSVLEKSLGQFNLRTALALGHLGEAYLAHQSFDKAEPVLLRNLQTYEALYGADDLNCASALSLLGRLYQQWDKPEKAEPYFRRQSVIYEKQYGPDNLAVAVPLENLADVLRRMGRSDEAAQVQQQLQRLRAANAPARKVSP